MASSPRSAEGREGRRRRLAERGSDRMALITGQIQSLPPLPPSPPPIPTPPTSSPRYHLPPRHVRPESLPVELSQEFHSDLRITQSFSLPASDEVKDGSKFSTRLRHQSGFKIPKQKDFEIISEGESVIQGPDNTNAEATKHQVPLDGDAHIKSLSDTLAYLNAAAAADEDNSDACSDSNSLNHQGVIKFSKRSNFQIRTKVRPLTQDSDTNSINPEANEQGAVKPSSATSRTQNTASDGTKKLPKPVSFNPTLFSSREINSSIITSETLRAFCALIIAVLVVLCYMISEKIAAIRPLFLVLLNDITIVLARVYIERIRASEEEGGGGERVEANNEHGHDWNGVKLLERGLVTYQAVRGVFIDCSVYLVIVISCVSLMN